MHAFLATDYGFYSALTGFMASFVLLFYFTARYRECRAVPVHAHEAPQSPLADAAETVREIDLEIAGFKDKVREMHQLLGDRRAIHEQQINEIVRNINSIVARLETVEPEHVERLGPNLQELIGELEELRSPVSASGK